MAFTFHVSLPTDPPDLPGLVGELTARLREEVSLDADTQNALRRGDHRSSQSPWPGERVGLFVAGSSTRGAELSLTGAAAGLEVRIVAPALGTWMDWRLAVEAATLLGAGSKDGVWVPGEGRHDEVALRATWLDDRAAWEAEIEQGYGQVVASVQEGRLVRIGGPAGFAVVGPRVLADVLALPPDDRAFGLLDRLLDSITARGFEGFHVAAPLLLDGSDGQEIVAAVLVPGRSAILRDPEFVLLSEDIEAQDPDLRLLPFARLADVFPARATWLDDRTAAIPGIAKDQWSTYLERARPWTTSAAELLDGPTRSPPPPRTPWWRFWDRHG